MQSSIVFCHYGFCEHVTSSPEDSGPTSKSSYEFSVHETGQRVKAALNIDRSDAPGTYDNALHSRFQIQSHLEGSPNSS
jgi:hypothetical protein